MMGRGENRERIISEMQEIFDTEYETDTRGRFKKQAFVDMLRDIRWPRLSAILGSIREHSELDAHPPLYDRADWFRVDRLTLTKRLSHALGSDYSFDHRGRLTTLSTYKLYVDLCTFFDKDQSVVYTGERVVKRRKLQDYSNETGHALPEIVQRLEVEV